MSLFPVFLKLDGKPVVVVGAGALARTKIEQLIAAGAKVRVIAGTAAETSDVDDPAASRTKAHTTKDTEEHGGECAAHDVSARWEWREFEAEDVAGATIVIAATADRDIDRAVFRACRERGVLCNAVDDPEFCDFYTPAVVQRGDLQIAISTNGQSPALAQQIRKELEGRFGAEWTEKVDELGRKRRAILKSIAPGNKRVMLLHEQARGALESNCYARRETEGRATQAAAIAADDPSVERRKGTATASGFDQPGQAAVS